MKIAIIGAGFAGVGAAWHLSRQGEHEITLFDEKGIGAGASGIAAGLLHPFVGARSKLNMKGREAMESTLELIQSIKAPVAENSAIFTISSQDSTERGKARSKRSGLIEKDMAEAMSDEEDRSGKAAAGRIPDEIMKIAENTGMLRIPATEDQARDFAAAARSYPDVMLQDPPGIFISSAWTVNTKSYLEELFKRCQGVIFEQRRIGHLRELDSFDKIIIATGSSAMELADIKITPVKGQLLTLEWPEGLAPLPFPVNSQVYIVMNPDNKSCIVGATYERNFKDRGPDLKKALEELKPKYVSLIPALENARIIDCKAGVRASASGHLPLVQQMDARTTVYTGLGSKGLLYHSLMAKSLVPLI